jgi:opacity protein-like surface antigen
LEQIELKEMGMNTIYLRHSLIGVILLLCLIPACYGQDEHHFTFNAGAGVSPLVGDIHNRLSNGWHVTVGGGYQFMPHFETNVQFTYNGFGVQPRVLDELGVPGGNSHMWSLTVDPKLRLGGNSSVDPYIVGGVGYYRRTVEFTSPTVGQIVLFDPFFDTFFSTLVRADQVLGNITRGGVGGSLGAGFDVRLGQAGLKLFVEARYHYADTGRIPTRMIPVTFGLKW